MAARLLTVQNRADRLGLSMIRRLLGFVFVLCLTGNSLAVVSLAGGDECGASCCRPPQNSQPSVSMSRDCCYSECDEPGETQPASPKGVLGIERNYKADIPVAVGPPAMLPEQSSRVLQSSARSVIQSTDIYLRIGTLLI